MGRLFKPLIIKYGEFLMMCYSWQELILGKISMYGRTAIKIAIVYKFQEAAKAQQKPAWEILRERSFRGLALVNL
jgi:hypothetical protein